MIETYVYVSLKLCLTDGQTEDSIREIIQDLNCSVAHDAIVSHEIVAILDTQIPTPTGETGKQGNRETMSKLTK